MHAARKEFQENNLGIEIITRLRGKMLTKRSKALSNINTRLRVISDIGFADDCVLCANSAEDLQQYSKRLHPRLDKLYPRLKRKLW
jgi:hypothetical protein